MASQFEPVIIELRDKSDKETNKQLLYQEYQKYSAPQLKPLRDEYVKELINQFENLIELFHYKHLHDYI